MTHVHYWGLLHDTKHAAQRTGEIMGRQEGTGGTTFSSVISRRLILYFLMGTMGPLWHNYGTTIFLIIASEGLVYF